MSDVMNAETLLAAMQRKLQRATQEMEDAQAALSRAKGEQALTDAIVNQMRAHKFTPEHIAIVTALVDPEQATVAACEKRYNAAAAQAAAAKKAVEMATLHVQMQGQGAAGAMYGN